MGVQPATLQRILRHSAITVTTGTYIEVIEAVQPDALDSIGTLFAHTGRSTGFRGRFCAVQRCFRLCGKGIGVSPVK